MLFEAVPPVDSLDPLLGAMTNERCRGSVSATINATNVFIPVSSLHTGLAVPGFAESVANAQLLSLTIISLNRVLWADIAYSRLRLVGHCEHIHSMIVRRVEDVENVGITCFFVDCPSHAVHWPPSSAHHVAVTRIVYCFPTMRVSVVVIYQTRNPVSSGVSSYSPLLAIC